jgi:hypothetical protein
MRLRASTVEMLIAKRSSQRSVVLDEVVRVVLFTKVDVALLEMWPLALF